MIVFITSAQRSGGTWAYNVTREIMQPDHAGFLGDGANLDAPLIPLMARSVNRKSLLIKFHHPSRLSLRLLASKQCKAISTIRDPRDCVASKMKFSKISFEKAVEGIKVNFEFQDWLKEHADVLFINYSQVRESSVDAVRAIANHVGMTADCEAIASQYSLAKVKALSKDTPKGDCYDSSTLLHHNHCGAGITGKWASWPQQYQDYAMEHLRKWVKDTSEYHV